MTLATLVTSTLQKYVLVPLNITFLQTIVFILVIASLVQMVEIILKKMSPSLYKALGVYLPLITTNCAVLGIAIKVTEQPVIAAHGFSIIGCPKSPSQRPGAHPFPRPTGFAAPPFSRDSASRIPDAAAR